MAFLYQKARRIAWNYHDPDKDGSGSTTHETLDHCAKITRQVQRLNRSAGLNKFANALKKDGCVIVRDFTDLKTLDKANEEVSPYLRKQREEDMKLDGWMKKTRTLTRLMERSPTIREKLYADSLYQLLCELFLTTETNTWVGNQLSTSVSHPLLSSAITFDMPAAGSLQPLHRDDQYYHARHDSTTEYEFGRDMLLGLFVPGTKNFEAGTMKVIPGSHLWGDEKLKSKLEDYEDAVQVCVKRGEALIILGSMYYGTDTDVDEDMDISEPQLLHAMFSCSGVHRQEENPFLTYSSKEVKSYSELVQERLGWRHREPSLGWIDLKSPEFLLGA